MVSAKIHTERARWACLCCRARKVRCDVIEKNPCTNCRTDSVPCIVSRKRRNRKIFPCVVPEKASSKSCNNRKQTHSLPKWRPSSPDYEIESANAHIANLISYLPNFIKSPLQRLSLADLEFLNGKGALSLPSFPTQCALIESYIEYAYHYMPVVDISTLISTVHNDDQISLLLYQAILFAGSAFVDCDGLPDEDPDFKDRRSARRLLATRVTLLYDLEYESDRLLLSQACLLMSTTSDLASNHKDSLYWSSLAISHAYAIGLNQDTLPPETPSEARKLRKRIWWTCLMRDRLLALGFHRPTTIKSNDFSTFELSADDFEYVVLQDTHYLIGPQCPTLRSPSCQRLLAEICKYRAKLGPIIEDILALQAAYSAAKDTESYKELHEKHANQFADTEKSLESWKESLPGTCSLDSVSPANTRSLDVLCSHMYLLYHTMVYSLHRPRFLPTSPTMISATSHPMNSVSRAKTIIATSQISQIAAKLKEAHLDRYLPISGLTVIFPAIVMNLLQVKSANQDSQALIRLYACMNVVKTMQQTYPAADVTMAYISAAVQKSSLRFTPQDALLPTVSTAMVDEFKDHPKVATEGMADLNMDWAGSVCENTLEEILMDEPDDMDMFSSMLEETMDVQDILSLQWELGVDDISGMQG